MKPRSWALLAAAAALAACYVLFYTEWLSPDPIQIQAQVRDMAPRQMFRERAVTAADIRKEREERAALVARKTNAPAKEPASAPAKEASKDASKEGSKDAQKERTKESVREAREAKAAQHAEERARMKTLAEERAAARIAEANAGRFDGMYPVVFALDGEYQLTQVRVIEVTPSVPGKAPKIVWQLDSTSNSVPTKALLYGRIPKGMKLKDDRSKAEKLEPGIQYRLEVKAGRYKGSTTFKAKESAPPPEPAPGG